MKIMKMVALFLCLAISLTFLVACVDDASNQGGGHYKDPSEQGDANGENADDSGNSENENNGDGGEGGSEIGGQGNGSSELEFPPVPIE